MIELRGNILTVRAPLTMTLARQAAESGLALLKGGDVVVDLAAVTEADSSALAVLLAWQRAQRQYGGAMRVVHVPSGLCSIARVYGMESEIVGLDCDADLPARGAR